MRDDDENQEAIGKRMGEFYFISLELSYRLQTSFFMFFSSSPEI